MIHILVIVSDTQIIYKYFAFQSDLLQLGNTDSIILDFIFLVFEWHTFPVLIKLRNMHGGLTWARNWDFVGQLNKRSHLARKDPVSDSHHHILLRDPQTPQQYPHRSNIVSYYIPWYGKQWGYLWETGESIRARAVVDTVSVWRWSASSTSSAFIPGHSSRDCCSVAIGQLITWCCNHP